MWVSLLIVNNYSEFQVNIVSNNRDIRKCQSFRTTTTTTPGIWQYRDFFFGNSWAKNSNNPNHSSQAPAPVKLVTKFALNGTCQLYHWRLPRSIFVCVRFTEYSKAQQQAHDVKMTSYQRWCNVMTSHRRRYDVILSPYAHWVWCDESL